MATIEKRKTKTGYSWRVMIRRHGFPFQSKTFKLKANALMWARAVELKIDRLRASDR
jgi:hypothetical protein